MVSGAGLPVPLFATPAFVGHVLFGLLLGAIYAVTHSPPSDTSAVPRDDADVATGPSEARLQKFKKSSETNRRVTKCG